LKQPSQKQYRNFCRKLIREKKIKQSWLAEQMGVSESSLSAFLNSEKEARQGPFDEYMTWFREALQRLEEPLEYSKKTFDHEALHSDTYGLASAHYCMQLGQTLTLWYPAVGNGVTPLRLDDVTLNFVAEPSIEFPTRFERLVGKVLAEKRQGKHSFEDGDVITIRDGNYWPPKGKDERLGVELQLGPTKYSALYTLRRDREGRKYLKELIDQWTPDCPFDVMTGQGLGVNVAVLSSDNQMVFGRRGAGLGVRPGQLDVGAVEGFTPRFDLNLGGSARQNIDLSKVIYRALAEEYGLSESKIKNIQILGFGFDLQYSQWNFIASADIDLPAAGIRSRQRSVAAHSHEYRETYHVPFAPKDVFDWLSEEREAVWSCGLATCFYTLVNAFGPEPVFEAADQVTIKPPQGFLWD
jgi:hypothetical protein